MLMHIYYNISMCVNKWSENFGFWKCTGTHSYTNAIYNFLSNIRIWWCLLADSRDCDYREVIKTGALWEGWKGLPRLPLNIDFNYLLVPDTISKICNFSFLILIAKPLFLFGFDCIFICLIGSLCLNIFPGFSSFCWYFYIFIYLFILTEA